MDIDVVIITIREDEETAILKRIKPYKEHPKKNQIYATSTIQIKNGNDLNIAVAKCPGQAQSAAQKITEEIIDDLNPEAIMVVGIGGGFPDLDFCLGDVQVITRVQDLRIKALKEGQETEFDVRGEPVEKKVERVAAALQRIDLDGWNDFKNIGQKQPHVDVSNDNFSGSRGWKEKVKKAIITRFGNDGQKEREPIVTTGAIVSTDNLVKDTERPQKWKKMVRKAIGCEMEMAGVLEASRQLERTVPVYGIRGISDIIGFERSEEWTKYACETAAAFAICLLKTGYIPYKYNNGNTLNTSKKLIRPNTFEPGTGFIDRGDVDSAVATILGEVSFKRADIVMQTSVISAYQKFGFINQALSQIEKLKESKKFKNLGEAKKAKTKLLEFKLNSQTGNYQAVIDPYDLILRMLGRFEPAHQAAVLRRVAIAYAAVGNQIDAKKCVEDANRLTPLLQGEHSEITTEVFSAITLVLGTNQRSTDSALQTLINAPVIYLESTLDRKIFQAHPLKSAVMCLFSEAAIRLISVGESAASWICLTAAYVLAPLGSAHPKAEGFAELMSLVNLHKEYSDIFRMAMHPDRNMRKKVLKEYPIIRQHLLKCQHLPEILNDRSPKAWLAMRQELDKIMRNIR